MQKGEAVWGELAAEQQCVVAQHQLRALGLTESGARWPVTAGRWRTIHPGVYVTHSGPVTDVARVWAAVLYAGPGAQASHRTALWLAGVLDDPPSVVQVSAPADRRVRRRAGLVIHVSRHLQERGHPAALPPRTTLDDALLDTTDLMRAAEPVLSLVFSATQRRLTTTARIRAALGRRTRHRWRALLADVLTDVADGVASPLERRYATTVERAHRLPRGIRNTAEKAPGGSSRYRDVRYAEHGLVVELDGRSTHPEERRFRDFRRDNEVVAAGDAVLRYGWSDVAARPCAVAGQVADVLRTRGWTGRAARCGLSCSLP